MCAYCSTLNVVSIKTLTLENKYLIFCYTYRNLNFTKFRNILSIGKYKLLNIILPNCKLLLCFYGFLLKIPNYYHIRYYNLYKTCLFESHHYYNNIEINKTINRNQKHFPNYIQIVLGHSKSYRNE